MLRDTAGDVVWVWDLIVHEHTLMCVCVRASAECTPGPAPESRYSGFAVKPEIARILKEEGYISNFKPTEEEGHKVIRIYLKYGANNEAAISKVERVSRPGCRVYVRPKLPVR